jgi:predicted AlkP superfamily pyrophosphatase or phosphodiesterase
MKKTVILFSMLCSALFGFHTARAQAAKYVVLVTIDGFRPDFYLDSSWGMVNLRHLVQNGVAAKEVTPVFPSVTYPDHTTIVTGVTPFKHGVYYNNPFEPKGATGISYSFRDSIKVETLWDAMHKAGRKTADIIWPVTVHDNAIDYNVPDVAIPGNKDRRGITEKYTTPAGLWKELQDSATGALRVNDWNMFDDELLMDDNIARMGSYLIRRYKPGFTAIHLAATDHYQHEYGRDGYIVRAAASGIDRSIKTILEAINAAGIKDSTALIITGDHGFETINHSFNPNTLLKQNGLMDDVASGNWKAQFFPSGGSAFLYLKDSKDEKTFQQVNTLLQQLPDSLQQYFRVITRKQMDSIGAVPGPVLALTALKGTTFGGSNKQLVSWFKAERGTHGHFPDHHEIKTGFIGYGAGLKKGVLIDQMRLLDIAPLIIQLTGIPFHEMDGIVHKELLK